MKILQVSTELAPLAKVGGLADVIYGLSEELVRLNLDTEIILPKYDCLDLRHISDLKVVAHSCPSFFEGAWHTNTLWSGQVDRLHLYLVESHHENRFFNRGCIYGCHDDIDRFLYFNRAVFDLLQQKKLRVPDVIHLHEWTGAALSLLLADREKGPEEPNSTGERECRRTLNDVKRIFTIHNLSYQGQCSLSDLRKIGLSEAISENARVGGKGEEAILMKGALLSATYLTAVSPSYAEEIKTPAFGCGLEDVVKHRGSRLKGILNGIDAKYWDPEHDPLLPIHFSWRNHEKKSHDKAATLEQKKKVKQALKERFGLFDGNIPLMGCVARLVPQKGLDFIKETIRFISRKAKQHTKHGSEAQFVLLGTSPIPEVHADFLALAKEFADHPHIRLILHHDEALAHFVYGASDLFLVPSLFEPCGLTQLIALRYGAVPIVRKTGGLKDSIVDLETPGKSFKETNGFTFDSMVPDAHFMGTLERALSLFSHHPQKWHELMQNNMLMDFSWEKPAKKYVEIYRLASTIF